MDKKQNKKDNEDHTQKKTFLGSFLAREKFEENYIPDLKTEWESMNQREKIKFILGGLIGLLIVIGAGVLLFALISAIRS